MENDIHTFLAEHIQSMLNKFIFVFNENKILWANSELNQFFNIKKEVVIGRSFEELVNELFPENSKLIQNNFAEFITNNEEYRKFDNFAYSKNIDELFAFELYKICIQGVYVYLCLINKVVPSSSNDNNLLINRVSRTENIVFNSMQKINKIFSLYQSLMEKNKELVRQLFEKDNDMKLLTKSITEKETSLILLQKKIQEEKELQKSKEEHFHNLMIQQNRENESKIAELTNFLNMQNMILANIGKELRTPLNGILGFTQLLQIEIPEKSIANEFLTHIKNSANKLQKILDNLTLLSDLETKNKKIDFNLINLNNLCLKFCPRYYDDAKGKKYEFSYSIKNEDITINADESLLVYVMEQLLDNSFKYTTRGFIRLEIEEFDNKEKKFALIKIKDSGKGISKTQLNNIFLPFKQVNNLGESEQFQSFGMSLAIIKKIVERMDGTIGIQSVLGQGTTVILQFPIQNYTAN
jgi:signal transduction histidine kinase